VRSATSTRVYLPGPPSSAAASYNTPAEVKTERKLNSERDILRAAAKYFAAETRSVLTSAGVL